MNNAKIFALVTLVINGLFLAYTIYSLATTDCEIFMEEFNKAMEDYKSSQS